MNTKLLVISNIPSPYRINFFNEWSQFIDLTVVFEKKHSSERNDAWKSLKPMNFKVFFLNGLSLTYDTAFSPSILKFILDPKYNHILIMNPLTATGLFSILILRLIRKTFSIETDGAFFRPHQKLHNIIRSFAYKKAKYVYCTSSTHYEYYQSLGVNKEQIVMYPFTSLTKKDPLEKPLTTQEKILIRKKIGIKESIVVLSVGQFIERKGFDVLIQASNKLPHDIGIYIIGGTNIDLYKESLKSTDFPNIHFLDFKNKKELDNYYLAADVFVHPTREDIWGLVINEAMSKALPIISTNNCLAATTLVSNGKNGYLIPIEEPLILSSKIMQLYANPVLRESMSQVSLDIIKNFTFETMVKKHMEMFK